MTLFWSQLYSASLKWFTWPKFFEMFTPLLDVFELCRVGYPLSVTAAVWWGRTSTSLHLQGQIGCASPQQLHIQREILQTCTMRTNVVSNFPHPRWIGTLVALTKLDCQRAFTLILLVCSPLDQAYRHGNEVEREREGNRERDGVGCAGMAWPPSNTQAS